MKAEKEFQWQSTLFLIILMLSTSAIMFLFMDIGTTDGSSEQKEDSINIQNAKFQSQIILDSINRFDAKTDSIVEIKEKVLLLEQQFVLLSSNSSIYSFIRNEIFKSEQRSRNLFKRSTIMLILGLSVALLGASGFYFALPEFKDELSVGKYFAKSIRPTLILIFIQSIAFYLLKQYRVLVDDYKYFHKDYEHKIGLMIAFQMIHEKDRFSESDIKMILERTMDGTLNTVEKKEEPSDSKLDQNSILKIIDSLKETLEKLSK